MFDPCYCPNSFLTTQLIRLTLIVTLIVGWIITPIGTSAAEEKGATLTGHVIFRGVVPPNDEVSVDEDKEFCGQTVSIQTIRMQQDGHGLQQAIVSLGDIKKGADRASRITSLRNDQCTFQKRINAVMLGDKLEIQNLDPILHNAHGKLGKRTILNVAQVPGGRSFRKKMKRPGQLKIKCDKHDFMKAHVMVFPHPYFSVTGRSGQFQIDSVPAGHHRITVWHETLGQIEKDIDIPTHGTVTVDFEFR